MCMVGVGNAYNPGGIRNEVMTMAMFQVSNIGDIYFQPMYLTIPRDKEGEHTVVATKPIGSKLQHCPISSRNTLHNTSHSSFDDDIDDEEYRTTRVEGNDDDDDDLAFRVQCAHRESQQASQSNRHEKHTIASNNKNAEDDNDAVNRSHISDRRAAQSSLSIDWLYHCMFTSHCLLCKYDY